MTLFLETNVTVLLFNESDNNRKACCMKLKKFHATGFHFFILRAPPLRRSRGGLEGAEDAVARIAEPRYDVAVLVEAVVYCRDVDRYVGVV